MRPADAPGGQGRLRPGPGAVLPRFERRHGSPLGEILLRTDGASLTGLVFLDQHDGLASGDNAHSQETVTAAAMRLLSQARGELDAYFAGRLQRFTVPVAWQGTPFQAQVWRGLLDIPYGQVLSYGAFARRLGLGTGHARAVGLANGANPVSLLVPCHRVIGAGGQLVGYGGGLARKRYLLALECGGAAQQELFTEPGSPGTFPASG